jgi:hypothetical protein
VPIWFEARCSIQLSYGRIGLGYEFTKMGRGAQRQVAGRKYMGCSFPLKRFRDALNCRRDRRDAIATRLSTGSPTRFGIRTISILAPSHKFNHA